MIGGMGPKRTHRTPRRIPKDFIENWNFYLKNLDSGKFTFFGGVINDNEIPGLDPTFDVMKSFLFYDSHGSLVDCDNPELFKKVLIFKKSLNFHIKMWGDGFEDWLMSENFYVKEMLEELVDPPLWVEKSLRNQIERCRRNKRK